MIVEKLSRIKSPRVYYYSISDFFRRNERHLNKKKIKQMIRRDILIELD